MIVIEFSKEWAEEFRDAINNGKPLLPPSGEWTGSEMITLAGMLYATIHSQGPHSHQAAGLSVEDQRNMSFEMKEATEETFRQDIHDGTEVIAEMTWKVRDGDFDDSYDPNVKAIVHREDDDIIVSPIQGFKHKE